MSPASRSTLTCWLAAGYIHEYAHDEPQPTGDRWLDEADHPLDTTLRRARDIILGADGRVTESIKWRTPTFAYKGNIASFNPSKNLVGIMFHRGAGPATLQRRGRDSNPRCRGTRTTVFEPSTFGAEALS